MPSSTLWTLLLLLPAVPIALLYAQRRTPAPAGLTKGQKKRAKRTKRGAGAPSGSTPVPESGEQAVASAPALPPAPAPASAPASKSKKTKRKKKKAEPADAAAIPGSFDAPAAPVAPAPLAPPEQEQGWQTPRKNKSRGPRPAQPVKKAAPAPVVPATSSAPEPAPEPASSAPSAPAPAWQEEPIDWGTDADRNWTADAQWGVAPLPSTSAGGNESETESESESDLEAEPMPEPAARGGTQAAVAQPAKRRKNKKPAAELHPSEFFSLPPVVPSRPVEAEWESVPTRGARAAPTQSLGATSGTTSRFSSKNAFSMLHEEGETPHSDDHSTKVIRIATSTPKQKQPTKRAAPIDEPTKKQRQNAAKREAAKLAREEAEKERLAALAAHRRARAAPVAPAKKTGGFASAANKSLDKATLLQLAQGSRKQPSNGQRAKVDSNGNLIWE